VERLFADVQKGHDSPLGSAEQTSSSQLQVLALSRIAELLEDTATNPDSSVRDSIEAQYIHQHRLPVIQRMAGEAYEQAVDADPDARRERTTEALRRQFEGSFGAVSKSINRVNHYRIGNSLSIPSDEDVRAQFEDKLLEWKDNGALDYVRAAERGSDRTAHHLVITPVTHYSVEDLLAMMGQLVPEDILDNLGKVTRKKGEINLFSANGEGLNYPHLTHDFINQYAPDDLTPDASNELELRFSLMPTKNHPSTQGQGITELPKTLKSLQRDFPWLREPYFTENIQAVLARSAHAEKLKSPMDTFAPSFSLPSVRMGSFDAVPIVYFDKGVRAGVATTTDRLGGRFVID
jgi:hypothetical protein